jgi:hypothetical protein
MKRLRFFLAFFLICVISFSSSNSSVSAAGTTQQTDIPNPNPPLQPVKLIFIHHSTGENWLADGYGNLGQVLAENNYFVSDTNYGWGPDSIGDRTDIPDWVEWFASEQTSTYMNALFSENGQNSSYSRLFDDPGGENQIIMFKSCFPNSALEGNPGDPPTADGWLSVGHAKYVYNEILRFFSTRPDKLFIVITAPPLSDSTYAENARAFNQWLVNDWLNENSYSLPNVAIFDFYNILTARDAHHRYNNGSIEHVSGSSNTLAYPSGDDHPSELGSRKATEEFIPLLNIYYNHWAATAPAGPVAMATPQEESSDENAVSLPPETILDIDDFETGASGWEASWDTSKNSSITCSTEEGIGNQGSASLRIDFSIAPNSWATCSRFFTSPQDWSMGDWLAFDIHSSQSGQPFNFILFSGAIESPETYQALMETPVVYDEGFISFTARWNDFLRVAWESEAGTPFENQGQVIGLAFGVNGNEDTSFVGTFWIDNIHLETDPSYGEDITSPKNALPCLGTIILPLVLIGYAWMLRISKFSAS